MSLRDEKVDLLSTRNINFHHRRITNASDAQDDRDYVTLRQLRSLVRGTAGIYTFRVDGALAIGSDLVENDVIVTSNRATLVKAVVKLAPVGDDIDIEIYQDATLWASLSIPNGSTEIELTASQLAALGELTLGNFFRVDLTSVGTTTTGADLTITVATI